MKKATTHITFAWTVWNPFGQRQQELSTMSTVAAMVTSRSRCSLRKKRLKSDNGQYQFRILFMLYADFESIFEKPGDEQYREMINKIKTEIKSKTLYIEKIYTHIPSGWCHHSTFVYGDVSDPFKMYFGKDWVETFLEHIEDEVNLLYTWFPQQPMTELTDVLKREDATSKKCLIFFKKISYGNRKVKDHCYYMGADHNNCNLRY